MVGSGDIWCGRRSKLGGVACYCLIFSCIMGWKTNGIGVLIQANVQVAYHPLYYVMQDETLENHDMVWKK